jgi:Holliday junction resolvase
VIGETQDIFKYYLGEENGVGLIISEVKLHGKHKIYVEPKDIETIQNYWKTKITNTK